MASGRGSNVQAIMDACASGRLRAVPCVVISNNSGSYVLQRARLSGVPGLHLSGCTHPCGKNLDGEILAQLRGYDVDVVCLAGYMKRVGLRVLEEYGGRILNIHPSLLPKYGGCGFYGGAVHRAVLAGGDDCTGATVHVIDGGYDTGPILEQVVVPVYSGDTAKSLAGRVLVQEHALYVRVLERIVSGQLVLSGL